ncbi:hypothetical protein [Paenibacillus ginsengarvi]|uniref:Aspartyl-phosphate phosphatase Spo0E family protein n=1 Tax=Paenibacillus ginsengarvi TaxID=400777 RepID=A0A3B0BTZ6_9BACL|nr:hypothetical protein [Paenibacillus ginsengarvi]RKN75858.1 hypothetical protein D7M11_25475 [Paenibacillus ginsengarvi]
MGRLLERLEAERRTLIETAIESLERGIPLAENEAVQAQSRKIDRLIVRLQEQNAGRERHRR